MTRLFAIALIVAAAPLHAATFKDAAGRTTVKTRTDANGVTTIYGPTGRVTGKARTDANGTTIITDPAGRVVGKIRR